MLGKTDMPMIELIYFELLAAMREHAPPEDDRDEIGADGERIAAPPDTPWNFRRSGANTRDH